MSEATVLDLWAAMWRPWLTGSLAPESLTQPINSGWSFGNITINGQNSKDPQTEMAILSKASYGQQIGKLLDAVAALVEVQPDAATNPAYVELVDLKTRIERVKHEAILGRVEQVQRDLETLQGSKDPEDQAIYAAYVAALRKMVEVGSAG